MPANDKKPHCSYSVAEWTRQPSSFEAIFGLELPYKPPKNPIAAHVWRWRLWGEVTFALSMLEPWEKLVASGSYTFRCSTSHSPVLYSHCQLCFHYLVRHDSLDLLPSPCCYHSGTCAILPVGPGRWRCGFNGVTSTTALGMEWKRLRCCLCCDQGALAEACFMTFHLFS